MLLWTLAVGTLSVLQPHPAHAAGITAVRSIPGLRSRVGARDLPIVPTACQDDCSPFQPFLTGACPAAQCCTAAFDIGYADCFTCVGNATGATDFTIAQEYVDVLITSCMAENFAIPVLTLPGQNPNRTLVSVLPPGASTIPVFPAEGSIVRQSATTETVPTQSATTASQTVPTQSATTASQSSLSQSVTTTAQSISLSQSTTAAAQSTATAPSTSSPSASSPSASSTAPPNAGVRIGSGPYVGLGFAAVLALVL